MQARSDSNIAQPPQNVFPESWDAFSLPDLSCVTLQMKRERLSTEYAVIVKKSNGAPISIPHLHDLDGDGNVVGEPRRDRDENHILSDAIGLVRKLPLHWIRKFALEDLRVDEMSIPESFEIPPALVKLIRPDMQNLTTLSLIRTCVTELFGMLTPPPPSPPMFLADLPDSDVTPELCTPCPTLKVLEMRHPVWIASQHCREALTLAKARMCEKAPFERASLCSPGVPKSVALGVSLYVRHWQRTRNSSALDMLHPLQGTRVKHVRCGFEKAGVPGSRHALGIGVTAEFQ